MDKTGIFDILNSLNSNVKVINLKELPTQGYFYPNDMVLKIKKATYEDIIEYNFNYIKNNFESILIETYRMIQRNIILNKPYTYEDIKVNDILYIFFEIVKFTMNKEIPVPCEDTDEVINFGKDTFNYFDFEEFGAKYLPDTQQFEKYGYKFTIPSIGVQNCLINYACKKELMGEYNDFNYNFMFFIPNKNYLTEDEINNLTSLFTFELDSDEAKKMTEIVHMIKQAIEYSLIKDGKVISISSTIDFENMFI